MEHLIGDGGVLLFLFVFILFLDPFPVSNERSFLLLQFVAGDARQERFFCLGEC